MKQVPLYQIFDIEYGNQFNLNQMEATTTCKGVAFVSRSSKNNGVVQYVTPHRNIQPYPQGLITVTLGGTYLLSSFVQNSPFYTAQNIKVLRPKEKLSLLEKLYYCHLIQHNRFRYTSHGREANKTLDDLLVPDIDFVKKQISALNTNDELLNKLDIQKFIGKIFTSTNSSNKILPLNTHKWSKFKFDDIFEIKKGYYNKKPPESAIGSIPFIGASDSNNGLTSYHLYDDVKIYSKDGTINKNEDIKRKLYQGKCITVSNNGSVGEAFYQSDQFICSHDINPLYLKDKEINLDQYIGAFLCTLIKLDKYRWSYGRKWRPMRMVNSHIFLPVTKQGNPDWDYMREYIKSLPI